MNNRYSNTRTEGPDDESQGLDDDLVEQLTGFDQEFDSLGETQPDDDTNDNPAQRLLRGKQALRLLQAIRLVDPQALVGDVAESDEGRIDEKVARQLFAEDDELASTAVPTTIGRFEILRQLGGGGQGVVFLARDPRLNRQVALKVPRPEMLVTWELRARFLREAEAAAALNHPNIVPVYEQGAVGPICYIASAYCDGRSLQDWARRQPPTPVLAAQIVAVLADAVQHAHSRGVLHRDIKPANVLLDLSQRESDIDDTSAVAVRDAKAFCQALKLTDFGLARLATSDGQTKSHAVIGTPAFMSPEQAVGQTHAVNEAADIYALGATLYWLLTGDPPLAGESDAETLMAIQNVDPQRPSVHNDGVPRDLDAVCLKCLEKQPAMRYGSAIELATDLQRFIDGVPVAARQITPAIRLGRWCRRNPWLAVCVATMLVIASGAFVWINHERNVANRNLKTALRQQRRAERNVEISRETADTLLTEVAERLANVPAAQQARQEILSHAVTVYQSLADDLGRDAESVRDASLASLRLGNICVHLGDYERGEQALAAAETTHQRLHAGSPRDQVIAGELAVILDRQAYMLGRLGKPEQAVAKSQAALAMWDAAADLESLDHQHHKRRLRSRMLHAMQLERVGRYDEAAALYSVCVDSASALLEQQPDSSELRLDSAVGRVRLGNVLRTQLDEADEAAELWLPAAVEILEDLVRDHPENPLHKEWLSVALGALTECLPEDQAEALARRALDIRQELADAYPNVPTYQYQASFCWFTLGEVHLERNEIEEAKVCFDKVVDIAHRLATRYPDNRSYKMLLRLGQNKQESVVNVLSGNSTNNHVDDSEPHHEADPR